MGYYWPSIVQLVVYGLIALISTIQVILGIVVIVAGWWLGIGGIIHGLATLGYCIAFFVIHKRSHNVFVHTKMDIIMCAVLAVSGIFIGIFCGLVAIGTFVLLLGNVIFESVFVATRKVSDKWNMTLYDLAEVDVTGSSPGAKTDNPALQQQWA